MRRLALHERPQRLTALAETHAPVDEPAPLVGHNGGFIAGSHAKQRPDVEGADACDTRRGARARATGSASGRDGSASDATEARATRRKRERRDERKGRACRSAAILNPENTTPRASLGPSPSPPPGRLRKRAVGRTGGELLVRPQLQAGKPPVAGRCHGFSTTFRCTPLVDLPVLVATRNGRSRPIGRTARRAPPPRRGGRGRAPPPPPRRSRAGRRRGRRPRAARASTDGATADGRPCRSARPRPPPRRLAQGGGEGVDSRVAHRRRPLGAREARVEGDPLVQVRAARDDDALRAQLAEVDLRAAAVAREEADEEPAGAGG